MTTDEQQLIQDILDGRTATFGAFVRRYGNALTTFVASFVGQPADVEEVVQQTFVAAFEHLSQYDAARACFQTWLWRIAHHTALRHLTRRRTLYIEEQKLAALGLTDDETDGLLAEVTTHRIDLLRLATDQLPPDDQQLLYLYYTEERPLADIAYIMEANANTLSSRLYRIRKRLAQLIKQLEHENE